MQSPTRDVDIRNNSFLSCLRKLFEEARTAKFEDLNCIFEGAVRNFDGTLKKEEFIYALLNKQEFTLTRTEIGNICALFESENVDVVELHKSYRQYLHYYGIIEGRIMELLEKFKLAIAKKIGNLEEFELFVKEIEDKATEGKIMLEDLK